MTALSISPRVFVYVLGIVDQYGIGQSELMWYVRSLAAIKRVFAAIWETEDLICGFRRMWRLPTSTVRETVAHERRVVRTFVLSSFVSTWGRLGQAGWPPNQGRSD